MEKVIQFVVVILIAIGIVFLWSLLLGFPVMWLWNYLMPEIFGLKEIGLWQSMCMLMFCGLLIKSGSSSSKKD